MTKKDINIIIKNSERSVLLSLFDDKHVVKEYTLKSKFQLSKITSRLCVISMIRWAICENLNANFHIVNFELTSEEAKYLRIEIELLMNFLIEKIGISARQFVPIVNYQVTKNKISENAIFKSDKITLGFSKGKDSICCQLLLRKAGFEVDKFRFDFDDADFIHDFFSKSKTINGDVLKMIETQSIFFKYNISYYQEEDMHLIYLAPILLYDYKGFYTKMCCGIQWDMLSLKGRSITIAESYASIRNLISLVKEAGFVEFGILLPLSSISSFGVYRILIEEFGFSALDNFNSCWMSDIPCSRCLKCRRVKFTQDVLEACITGKFYDILDIIRSNQIEFDLLFGSQNIDDLLSSLNERNIRDISKDLYMGDLDPEFDQSFSNMIEREYSFKRLSKL